MSGGAFSERVFEIVARIPRGHVVTYGQIAERLGLPRGARQVGWAMRNCPSDLPWHRVVNASGRISRREPPAAMDFQRTLLEEEGIEFSVDGCIDLERFGWRDL